MHKPAQLIVFMAMMATGCSASARSLFSPEGTSRATLLVQAGGERKHRRQEPCVGAQCPSAIDRSRMVLNENKDRLPPGCVRVREHVEFTVSAGRKYAEDYSGTAFGFDRHEWRVQPCARITVRFVNEDDIRHQWMVHDLPSSVYSGGTFLIEVSRSGERTGSFIAPAENKTYLVHCHLAQHMEKGMKGQLVVGTGSGDLSSIPGISAPVRSNRTPWFTF
jgi:hypothetical protein